MSNGLLLLSILLLTGVNAAFSNDDNRSTPVETANINARKIKVVASFFPVRKVGGDKVDTFVLVPIGTEPHGLDSTIQQIQSIESASIVVYNGAGVEAMWINKVNPKFAIDTSKAVYLFTNNDPQIHVPTDPHINIIYSEDLIDPCSYHIIADEIPNGKVMVLSAIEGINKQEQQKGVGYLEKMYENLAALKEGLRWKN